MKIALLTEYTEIGGGESNLLNLAQELSKNNNVTIFCGGKVQDEAKKRDLKTINFKTTRRWIKFIPLFSFYGKLQQELDKFDIVHAYSVNVLPLLISLNSKVIWTTHGFWEKPNGLKARIIDKIVDKVICVSTDVYNIADFNITKKEIIFLGTNFELIKTLDKTNIDKKNIHLVCIGRFQKIKGQDLLIDALQIVANKYKNIIFNLSIVGDVNGDNTEDIEYKNNLYSQVEKNKYNNLIIKFEGFRSNVRHYILNSNIVVIPSRYESFSMVAIEAFSCAKPIIAPNVGGPKDIVNTRDIGVLFEAENIIDLADKIIYAINYNFDYTKILERAKYFTIENQAKKHLNIYKELLNEQ